MHGSTYGLWTWAKTDETNTTVLGIPDGGHKGGTVLKMTFQDGESIYPGGPSISYRI